MSLIVQPDFEYDLVAYKGFHEFVFSGKSTLTDFNKSDKNGITKLGWQKEGKSIFVDLINGSFELNGFKLFIDPSFTTIDEEGNIRAIKIEELEIEPVWFRRIRQDFSPSGIRTVVKYCIGWKTVVYGRSVQKIAILDDQTGEITLSDSK